MLVYRVKPCGVSLIPAPPRHTATLPTVISESHYTAAPHSHKRPHICIKQPHTQSHNTATKPHKHTTQRHHPPIQSYTHKDTQGHREAAKNQAAYTWQLHYTASPHTSTYSQATRAHSAIHLKKKKKEQQHSSHITQPHVATPPAHLQAWPTRYLLPFQRIEMTTFLILYSCTF